MPSLNWIGKDKVVNHDKEVPFHHLKKEYSYGEEDSGNMVIHGDNLPVLKSLLPEYAGKIDVCYLDPPYNTGKESWIYNDNVNDPIIKKWIGNVVGPEGEDLSRHDKWLCMMYPRLKLVYDLLADNGFVFISIDENELFSLKLLCEEIFGKDIELFLWKKTDTPPNLSHKIRRKYEYILCCGKNIEKGYRFSQGEIDGGDAPMLNESNKLTDLAFPANSVRFTFTENGVIKKGSKTKVKLENDIVIENGRNQNEFKAKGHWKWSQTTLNSELENGTEILVKSKLVSPRYLRDASGSKKAPQNNINGTLSVGTNEDATTQLEEIFQNKLGFDYPKPVSLIKFLINMVCKGKDIIVLDAFAGSGTTAHAVLEMNKEDNGDRKFILCEMGNFCEDITAERIRRVIEGYSYKDKDYSGTGGGFSYFETGEPILDNAEINPAVTREDLSRHIAFTELGTAPRNYPDSSYKLAEAYGNSYYLIWDNDSSHENILDLNILNEIGKSGENRIVYAEKTVFDEEELDSFGITFKKIPNDLRGC